MAISFTGMFTGIFLPLFSNFFTNFFIRQILLLILWLLLASFFIFTLFFHLPGDAGEYLLGIQGNDAILANLREQLGLNQSFWVGYYGWILEILQGNLGKSMIYQTSLATLLAAKIPISVILAVMSLLLSNIIAIPLGLWLAIRHHGKKHDNIIMFLLLIFLAIPSFWCAMLITLLLSIYWQLLPAGGFDSSALLQTFLMPVIVLSLPQIAIMARFTRIQALNILQQPFIITAYCKGCSPRRILSHHLLKNIAPPLLTLSMLQFAFLFSGTIVVENIFFLPGMGQFAVQSLLKRDITALQIIFLFFVLLILCLNLFSDVVRRLIDPRTR